MPPFGFEHCGAGATVSLTLHDDGTGAEEQLRHPTIAGGSITI